MEWDDLVWKATAAYNFFPTESSGMAPFFLMFGREANVKHNLLASEKPKYMGTDESMINLELMSKLYLVVAHNLHEARKARDKNCSRNITREVDILRLGDNVLVRDHTSKVFQPKYKDFCITGFLGKNQIEVKDNHGHTMKVHRRDIKKIPMTEKISQMYEEEQINKIRNGRKLVPDNVMPNLQWNLEKQEATHKEEIQETEETNRLNRALEMIIYMVIFIYSYILQIQEKEETNRLNRAPQVIIHSVPVHKNSRRSNTGYHKNDQEHHLDKVDKNPERNTSETTELTRTQRKLGKSVVRIT